MENRQEILMKLYWKMWKSADFSSDFQRDFPTVYQKIEVGNHYQISLVELKKSWYYLREWERKNIFKNY